MVFADQPEEPPYLRLAVSLRTRIASGKLRRGDLVPSITVLCREHGMSRPTADKTMRLLEREGLVILVPGRGYYVR